MRYQVLDDGKPADTGFSSKNGKGQELWSRSTFDTLNQAVDYAISWLGAYGNPRHQWAVGVPFIYGYGSSVVIVEIV
jgi:hypothetical protein